MSIASQSLIVTHVAEDMAKITGGIPAVVCQLSQRLSYKGISSEVVYASGNVEPILDGVVMHKYPPSRIGRLWFYSSQLKYGLRCLIQPSSDGITKVLHVHGAWSAPQFLSAINAYKSKVPIVFTAHGMLEPWLWNNQGIWILIKKRIYWHFFAKRVLSRASVIHAITPLEMTHLSKLFPGSRIEIIPNAVDILDLDKLPSKCIAKRILFLGRIEPKKGVDLLLHAFADANLGSEWSLEIAGPIWSNSYYNRLCKIIDSRNIHAGVRFLGPLFGLEKQEKIDTSWVLAAPSYSEVVGLVNLEASSRRVPTITTYQTGLYDWEDGGGILIDPTIASLAKALKIACSWSLDERIKRGISSHGLIKQRYSWEVVIKKWAILYSSTLNEKHCVE